MRILMTTDVIGGVWDFCCALTAQLTTSGQEVVLLAFGQPSANQVEQARASGAQLLAEPLRLEWMPDGVDDVQRARQITRDLTVDLRPNVVHANQFALGGLDLPAPTVLTAHSDVLSWGKWTRGWQETPDEWRDYAMLVHEGLRKADIAVAVSAFLAAELEALYRLERPLAVVHNGWPVPPTPPEPASRANFSILAGRAWDEAKNIGLASRALRGQQCGRVVFAGDLSHPASMIEPPLGDTIEPLGRLTPAELMGWLRRARVYVSPARYDPFGLLPLQAALCGCALLLSDIPSYRELWDGAAAFFPSDDEGGLRRQWTSLLADEAYAAHIAGRACQRAVESYAAGSMAARYLDYYRQAVSLGSRASEVLAS